MPPNPDNSNSTLTLEGIRRELVSQVKKPMGRDGGIAGFALAMSSAVEDTPELADIMVEADKYHYVASPRDVVHQTLRAVQAQAIMHEVDGYPYDYLAEDLSISAVSKVSSRWSDLIFDIVTNSRSIDELAYDVQLRRMQSMQVERSKAVKLIGLALQERFGLNPKVLDVGTSQMHGPKHLMLGLPFTRTVMDGAEKQTEKRFNQEVRRHWRPSAIDCVDIFFPDDPSNKNWAFANSFYPKELADPRKVARYRRLSDANVPGVAFARADFSAEDPEPQYLMQDQQYRMHVGDTLKKHEYDVISTLTMLYQLSPEERRQWFVNCKDYLKPDGVIVVSDFAALKDLDESACPTDSLNFDVKWTDEFSYRTFVYDNATPEKGFQEVYRWLNGRCRKVQITGSTALRGALFETQATD